MGTPRVPDVYRHASAGETMNFSEGEGARLKFKGEAPSSKGGFRTGHESVHATSRGFLVLDILFFAKLIQFNLSIKLLTVRSNSLRVLHFVFVLNRNRIIWINK